MAKIMLVEDDNNLREIYGARLLAEGHEIVSAKDGEEALAIAVKEKPNLIISDIMMPKISGFDMLDILRNAPETKYTKVIMMTALSQTEDKERADKLGADRYLVKSQVTLEDVARTVREVLEGKTEEESNTQPTTPSKPGGIITPEAPVVSSAPTNSVSSTALNESEPSFSTTPSLSASPVQSKEILASENPPSIQQTEIATPITTDTTNSTNQPSAPSITPLAQAEPEAPSALTGSLDIPTTNPIPTETTSPTIETSASPEAEQGTPSPTSPTLNPITPYQDNDSPQPMTKINVTLPDDDIAQNIEKDDVPSPFSQNPEQTTTSVESKIGDNLDAIMQRELSSNVPNINNHVEQSSLAQPQSIPVNIDRTSDQQAQDNSHLVSEDGHKKNIIQPINDITKPSINDLMAKEESSTTSTPNTAFQTINPTPGIQTDQTMNPSPVNQPSPIVTNNTPNPINPPINNISI